MKDLARVLSYRFGHNPRRYVSGTLHLLRPLISQKSCGPSYGRFSAIR